MRLLRRKATSRTGKMEILSRISLGWVIFLWHFVSPKEDRHLHSSLTSQLRRPLESRNKERHYVLFDLYNTVQHWGSELPSFSFPPPRSPRRPLMFKKSLNDLLCVWVSHWQTLWNRVRTEADSSSLLRWIPQLIGAHYLVKVPFARSWMEFLTLAHLHSFNLISHQKFLPWI
jgi:hypothetical protein